jgi:metallo-beta-lactamase family protein
MMSYSTKVSTEPRVTFFGAAQSVTGSMHLVEVGDQRLLLDCGMARVEREEQRLRNGQALFPFDPTTIDAVIVSHAHVDHIGNLPNLVRQGYQGPIYCTPATRDLMAVMLADSARIHEEEVHAAQVVGKTSPAPRGGFTRSDADLTIDQCVVVPYQEKLDVSTSAQLRFVDAGHILGSAMVHLKMEQAGRKHTITFTGDLGRSGLPFLSEANEVPASDLLICESTYGGRKHETVEKMAYKLSDAVRRTVARGGKVLIPAFSLGRTQIVVHYLQRWMRAGLMPVLPIYVDSPLASDIADVYQQHSDDYKAGGEPGDPVVQYVRSADESKELSLARDPYILVASGGMCDGGRIVQHLRNHIDDPRSTVVLVSYQSPFSLGHRLLEMRPTVRFHGRTWNKWLEVVELNGFSGHADHNDFLTMLGPLAERTRQVRLVHGELPQATALASGLRDIGFTDVVVPQREEMVTLSY